MADGLRRWWGRYSLQATFALCLVLAALWLRSTQGNLLSEWWYWLNWPAFGLTQAPPNISNSRIAELEGRLNGLEQENLRLRNLLALPQGSLGKPVAAQVIGRDGDHWWRTLILNQGSDVGIRLGNPVTAPGGLVGEVVAVSAHTTRVLLVSDPQSKVGVVISRTGAMGILSGLYKSEATVEFFDSHAQVRQGDTVITSGLSSRFPANIAVGKVSQPPNRQAEPFQVTVRFTAPLDGLQWVLVYPEVASRGLDVPQP